MLKLEPIASDSWQQWLDSQKESLSINSTNLESYLDKGALVFSFSDYVRIEAERHPDMLLALIQFGVLNSPFDRELDKAVLMLPDRVGTEFQLMQALRRFRRYHMMWIYWRDLSGQASLEETCGHVSWLADNAIQFALEQAHKMVCEQLKQNQEELLPLVVMAMGKYGAEELNVSSDIDLIFCYSDDQEKPSNLRSLELFYTRVGQKLIQLLDQRTADGFVFRVDMRLRPYGDSGALVMSESAFESYYLEQGRDWERFAMIKARIVTGTDEQRTYIKSILKPFVFRRYVDFSVLDSPREMKRLIQHELRRRNLGDNIKLGAGGIREIEFIAQALQLIHGGKDPELQDRKLLTIMPRLVKAHLLDEDSVSQLVNAYHFLRLLEHRIQGYKDQQTQLIPDEPELRDLLGLSMGYKDWAGCEQDLTSHRNAVHSVFSDLFATAESEEDNEDDVHYHDLWLAAKSGEDIPGHFDGTDLLPVNEISETLAQFAGQSSIQNMGPRGEQILNHLMPVLLSHISKFDNQAKLFQRVIHLINAISSRTAYLELLKENLPALELMLELCSKSALIAESLAEYPFVLDELLNPLLLHDPETSADFDDLLRQSLSRIPADDIESRMDALREVRQTQLLRLEAADLATVLDVSTVGERLSNMAIRVVEEAAAMAWQQLAEKHGTPDISDTADTSLTPGFCVIAYGKLGSGEMGYSSDLDLVFIYDAEPGQTNGLKPLDTRNFYVRLAQKIIHFLSMRTRTGVLYEVDMRLRPSGNSGLLVSHIDAFENYQNTEAWTWEHQALIRTRAVLGEERLVERFNAIRRSILCRERDSEALALDVSKMRKRMQDHTIQSIPADQPDSRDLKQSSGGIADIEFLVQYWVLNYANQYQELTQYCRTSDIITALKQVTDLDAQELDLMSEHFLSLRQRINLLSLQKRGVIEQCSHQTLADFDQVQSIWSRVFGDLNNED